MAINSFDEQYYALLASRIREGDADAFAELYGATYDTLLRTVRYFLHNPDDARDALQETYISVYKNISGLKIDRLLLPWMRQIAYHICCDFLRQSKVRREMSTELSDSTAPPRLSDDSPYQRAYDRESWDSVTEALSRRPFKERQAFLLRYSSGLKLEEIAELMGVSLASVKRYINAARASLQKDVAHLKP